MAISTVFLVSVARSVWELWTGRPSGVRPVVCLVTDDAGAERLGGFLVVIVIEHGRQALAHVPFEVVAEHAQEDVGAHPLGQPVVDRADVEVDGLDRADGPLDQAEGL